MCKTGAQGVFGFVGGVGWENLQRCAGFGWDARYNEVWD